MKISVCRLFEDARRAEGTVRELVLMQIPERDITMTALRDGERRSFASSPRAEEAGPGGLVVRANVDQADGPRVEATLVRNGGVDFPPTAPSSLVPTPNARLS
jgi:hypothetical protein